MLRLRHALRLGSRTPAVTTTTGLARVIVVAGCPRSGTTALFDVLSTDRTVIPFHEPDEGALRGVDEAEAIYREARLRPEPDLRARLVAAPGPVVLRGNEELAVRSLDDLALEFAAYDLSIVWIYREAAKVIGSAIARRWWEPTAENIDRATAEWVRRHGVVLGTGSDRLTVVSYRDLAADPTLTGDLVRRLGLEVRATLGVDLARGLSSLPPGLADDIEARTAATFAALEDRRTLRPDESGSSGLDAPLLGQTQSGRLPLTVRTSEPISPETLAGLRLWLRPDELAMTDRDDVWPSAVPGLPGAFDLAGAPVEVTTETACCPAVTFTRDSTRIHLLEAGRASTWGFLVDREWTIGLALRLPVEGDELWSPVVTCGSPLLGDAGMSLVWLGPDTDERPSAGDGRGETSRSPGSSLLMAGIVEARDHTLTSSAQATLVVKMEVATDCSPWATIVVSHRLDGGSRELWMHVRGRRVAVHGEPSVAPPPSISAGDDRLLIGGHPAGPSTSFQGAVAELFVIDQALSASTMAGLAAHLQRHPQFRAA